MSEPRDIKPMPADEIAKLKAAIERRWDEKPWYGGDGDLGSPGCMMRAHEVLALIAAAELGLSAAGLSEVDISEDVEVTHAQPDLTSGVKPKVIKRRVMVELLGAVYDHHGWKRVEGESRPARVQELYDITADMGKNLFIATPKSAVGKSAGTSRAIPHAVVERAACVIKDAFDDAGVEVGGTFARKLAGEVFALGQPAEGNPSAGRNYDDLIVRLEAVQHSSDRPYAASVAKDAAQAIRALTSPSDDVEGSSPSL